MTPDLQREFVLLSKEAKQRLRNVAASGSYRNVFSVWVMPSFSPSFRYTLYSPTPFAKKCKSFADYYVWRSDLDLEKFVSPIDRLKHPTNLSPTIENDSVELTGQEIEEIEQRLRGISIPVVPGNLSMIGLDGTCFELNYNNPLWGFSLRWWEDHPQEWHPFTETVKTIVSELENRRKEKAGKAGEPPIG